MKSNLSKKEFEERLTALTSKEKIFYFFTPYNSSGTPFCGTYDDKTFDLTKNSFWRHVKVVVIKGEYRELDNNSTEVEYEIGCTTFMRNLFVVFSGFVFIGVNIFVIVNHDSFDASLFSIVLTLNGLLIFANLLGLTVNWVTKKIVNQRFKDEFEIGVEDEWEKLANSINAKPPDS